MLRRVLIYVLIFIVLFMLVIVLIEAPSDRLIPENEPERGAAIVQQDQFGDSFSTIEYLDQGWDATDSLWFYTTTQGSDLMPYDFFMVLEQPGKDELFRSNDNMNFYRYLPQKATRTNPDALPVGWVKDDYKDKEYIGLTCAACHTGQVNYNGVGIRIDGGPAAADMETIMKDLAKALKHTFEDEETRNRFVKNVLARGNYQSESKVLEDLKRFKQRLIGYIDINRSNVAYGYARLDAFGRIYNRVLEHLVNKHVLEDLILNGHVMGDQPMSPEEFNQLMRGIDKVMTSEQRDDLVENLTQKLDGWQLGRLREALFNRPNAPVSYPFLWDIAQHDYVQWNGLAQNAGLGSIGRNVGEVIGVFGMLDWKEEKRTTLSTIIGSTDVNFSSSVNVHNLRLIESHLNKLQSPKWPEEILGAIDRQRAERGRLLYSQHCVECHTQIERADPNRRVVAHMSRVSDVGTDPMMAANSINATGYSGILRNGYVNVSVGNILLDEKAPVAALLTKATLNVVATPDPDKWFFQRWADWIVDITTTFFSNEIKPSIKQGRYDPDTTAMPLASMNSYKARPLNGIWATAPYLHNGSVPTLYDLLLPKKRANDPDNGKYRPDHFVVGSREFDPNKVGLKENDQGFVFDTSKIGNSNAGHEYATYHLGEEDRMDLLEYLKTL